MVIFTETPGPGAALSSWNGPCQAGTGGTTTSCTITVTNPIGVIQAIYTNGPLGPFTLTTALPTNTTSSTGNGTVGVGVTAGGIGLILGPVIATLSLAVLKTYAQEAAASA